MLTISLSLVSFKILAGFGVPFVVAGGRTKTRAFASGAFFAAHLKRAGGDDRADVHAALPEQYAGRGDLHYQRNRRCDVGAPRYGAQARGGWTAPVVIADIDRWAYFPAHVAARSV